VDAPEKGRLSAGAGEPRWKVYACLALLLAALAVVVGPKVRLLHWQVEPGGNTALDEALQWRRGNLALSHRFYESARAGEKYYNVTGLAFTLVSVAATTLTDAGALLCRRLGCAGDAAAFPAPLYIALVALPLPIIAFYAFRGVMKDSPWAAVLAFYLIAGTALTHVLGVCQGGSIYYINHVLAVVGLLIFAADLLGRRRLWPAAIGLCLAAWSRQMTILYALPLLWAAWRAGATQLEAQADAARSADADTPPPVSSARRRAAFALLGMAVAVGVPALLNTLKFGSPFESGYTRLYEGRTDRIGRRAQEAVFGMRYIPMHARAMNTAYPCWDVRKSTPYADTADMNGGSIWLTSPILLGVFVTWRRWWRDPARRALMLGTLPVIFGLMCYHTTGADGAGCYRYSLDFIPVWLLVIAPYILTHRGNLLTVACLAYSTAYFYYLPP